VFVNLRNAGNLKTWQVLILLELGANPDAADLWGSSPLHLAAWKGEVRCAERLLDGGAGGTAHDNKVLRHRVSVVLRHRAMVVL